VEQNEAKEYRQTLSDIIKSEPDKAVRREFLREEMKSDEYIQARESVIEFRREKLREGEEFERISKSPGENPLAEIHRDSENLTEEERDLLWANRLLVEYNESITGGDRRRAKEIASLAARRLVKKTETIGKLASVWKVDPRRAEVDSAYNQILHRTYKEIKDDWKDLSPEQIVGLIKSYAHEEIGRDFVEELLKAYFKGPNSRRQRVDAYYNFVFASLDLVNDQKAIDEVVRIGFFDTEIIPRDSEFHRNFILGRATINDDVVLGKAIIADNAIFNLSFLSTVDITEAKTANARFTNSDPKIKEDLERMIVKASKVLGAQAASDRAIALMNYNDQEKLVFSGGEETAEIFARTWPYSLVSDERDRLHKKEALVIGPLVLSKRLQSELFNKTFKEKFGEIVQLSIPTPDGLMLEVAVPIGLLDAREELVRHLLENERLKPSELEAVKSMFGKPVEKIAVSASTFKGNPYVAWYRPMSESENLHPINALSEVGVPFTKEGEDLGYLGNALASDILRTQIRFLNKRGVRIPLEFKEFKELGYREVVFKARGSNINVELDVLGNKFTVDLDENLNLDLGNRTISSGALRDSIRYLVLKTLRPVLCMEDFQNKAKGAEGEETAEILSRMGHLRLLPEGFRFTDKAVINFFNERKKDLRVVNAQRMIELNTARYTTYVKEVKEREDNLPPVVIHLPPEAF